MSTPSTNNKVPVCFYWVGSNTWNGGWSKGGLDAKVIDLIFQGSKTSVSVSIPDGMTATDSRKLSFTCRKYGEQEVELNGRKFKPLIKESAPDLLNLTVDQILNLTLKIGIFEESPNKGPSVVDRTGKITQEKRVLRSDRAIALALPESFEPGKIYKLTVTAKDFSFSADLQKVDEDKFRKEANRDELARRARVMGEALISEGMSNMNDAFRARDRHLGSTSTNADLYALGIQGVLRAGQQAVPGISVPTSAPLENIADLKKLTVEELQKRFEETFVKDKQFETQRFQAAKQNNLEQLNQIIANEFANSQLLIMLAQTLEEKGVTPQIPNTENFKRDSEDSSKAHEAAFKEIQDSCKMQ